MKYLMTVVLSDLTCHSDPNLYCTKVMIGIRGNVPRCLQSDACSMCDSRRSVWMCERERDVCMILCMCVCANFIVSICVVRNGMFLG